MDKVTILICLLVLLCALHYKYFLVLESDYDDLTNINVIKDLELHQKLDLIFYNCPNYRCYLRALDLLETYSNSTHLLYQIYKMAYSLGDYERSYSFLKDLEKLLPSNQKVKDRLIQCENKIVEQKRLAKEIEEESYSDGKFLLKFKKMIKFEGFITLNPLAVKDEHFVQRKTYLIRESLNALKENPFFPEKIEKLKILWELTTEKLKAYMIFLMKQQNN